MIDFFVDLVALVAAGFAGAYIAGWGSKDRPVEVEELDCPHVWDQWSKPSIKPLHGGKDNPGIIGMVVTQVRSCTICGLTQYD